MRRCAGQYRNLSSWFNTDCRTFPTTGRHRLRWTKRADLDIRRDADADKPSFIARFLLLFTKSRVAGDLLCFVESSLVITTVVIKTCGGVEWKVVCSGKILSTHFSGIDTKLLSNEIQRTFDDVSCFRTAGAAVCVCGHLVGEAAGDVHLDRRDTVSPGEHQAGQRRNRRCEQLMIRA